METQKDNLILGLKYRKSYERECVSGFMSTSDVLKVGECNLRTFKTSRVPTGSEMHKKVHTIFYLLYIQQNYYVALLLRVCTLQVLGLLFLQCFRFAKHSTRPV